MTSTKCSLTPRKGLQFLEQFLVSKISLMSELEPTARALGRIESYKDTLKALENLLKRTKTEKQADRSHVKELSLQ